MAVRTRSPRGGQVVKGRSIEDMIRRTLGPRVGSPLRESISESSSGHVDQCGRHTMLRG